MTDLDHAATKRQMREEKATKRQNKLDVMNANMDARRARMEAHSTQLEGRGEEIKEQRDTRRAQAAAANDERKAEREARNELKRQARKDKPHHPIKYMTRLGGHFITNGEYQSGMTKVPISGATADYESGANNKRVTGTRVITGAVLLGPVGALAGGVLRKNKTKCYVTITFADGNVAIIDAPVKDEPKARKFAATVNAAGAFYADRD